MGECLEVGPLSTVFNHAALVAIDTSTSRLSAVEQRDRFTSDVSVEPQTGTEAGHCAIAMRPPTVPDLHRLMMG